MINLITVDQYKASKSIESVKDDQRIQNIIDAVSQLVKTYCANSFVDYYTDEKIEYVNVDWPTDLIQLTESPVVELITVEERASYGDSYIELTQEDKEFYFDSFTDCIRRTTSGGYRYWAQGPGAVRVTYTAGYDVDDLPADLRLAVFDLVTYYHKEEYKERRTIGGTSISNQPSSTQWRNVDFPDHIKRVLDLYKQI